LDVKYTQSLFEKNDISLFTENLLSTLYNPNVNGFFPALF